jgi:hypothetical protein
MDDFDILYMMKTPLYLGNLQKVIDESQSIELNEEDQANITHKNLLAVRALTAMHDFDRLKLFMKSIIDGDTPQKSNIQGFSILVTYLVKNVSAELALTFDQQIDKVVVEKTEQLIESDPTAIEH